MSTAKVALLAELLAHTGNTATQIDSILVSIIVIKLLVIVIIIAADYPGAPCTS